MSKLRITFNWKPVNFTLFWFCDFKMVKFINVQTSVLTYRSLLFTVIIVPGIMLAFSTSSGDQPFSPFDCFFKAAAPMSTQKIFPSTKTAFCDDILLIV